MAMAISLGTKLYYSIGEVADLTELAHYTLRAWEGEFSCLRPKRVRGKNRAYKKRDIAIILLIRRLLHEERYSTRGAQQKLRNEPELVRGAVDCVDHLCADDPPTLEELSFAGRGEGVSGDEPSGVVERTPPEPAEEEGRALMNELRDELREILRLFR
jgi:DNA-binding transcriptional MerR regulator